MWRMGGFFGFAILAYFFNLFCGARILLYKLCGKLRGIENFTDRLFRFSIFSFHGNFSLKKRRFPIAYLRSFFFILRLKISLCARALSRFDG